MSIAGVIKKLYVVIVRIYNEVKTINEVSKFNKNIIVVATKLQRRGRRDIFSDWKHCEDMQNIQRVVHAQIGEHVAVLPLKFSSVFDTIFEQEKSVSQLMQSNALNKYHYQEVNKQFESLYQLIESYAK